VNATSRSGQLDPEDYQEVVHAYYAACAEVVQRFDGSIAQYLGDGVLVYFGYPHAHEDDAHRAVRAGIELVAAIGRLQPRLGQAWGERLAIRVGIHTGLVVVGPLGRGGRQEPLALGETPNLAARLQGLAAPDTVVISAATARLVQGYFACHDLGQHALKGVVAPVHVWQALGLSGARSRLEIASPRGLTPLVGRDAEVALLRERWAQVKDGLGQVVLLSGEAGIGKSRLVQVVKEQVAGETCTRLEGRGLPSYQPSAFSPMIAYLQRALAWERDDSPAEKLRKLEAALAQHPMPLQEVVPLFAALLALPLPAHYAPLLLTPQGQRHKTLEALLAWLLAEAARQPVLLIIEDLHWVDPSTLELLSRVVEQGATTRIYSLFTFRPDFTSSWTGGAHLTPISLGRLSRPQVECMVQNIAGGKALPAAVVQQVVARADGVPLFAEELTKTVLEAGLLREAADHYTLTGPLPALAVPATLQDALMARLDQVHNAKAVAQLGATIGRQFSYELLQAVSPLDAATLQRELARLVDAEVLLQRGLPPQATYLFKHALIQEAAYQSVLKRTRQHCHRLIAQVLTERFAETVATQPELLAHHYTAAGLPAQAIPYWQQAGQYALAHSTNTEAIGHLTTGLTLLATLPDTPERCRQELDVQTTLGPALMATRDMRRRKSSPPTPACVSCVSR
jgi:predicted ATPase/class 3 adenylate cyclase